MNGVGEDWKRIDKEEKKKRTIDPKASQGNKKCVLTNIPLTMFLSVALPINDGAKKYGKYNWLEQEDGTLDTMTYINALLRHILLYLAGQDYTSDSGVHHLSAIQAGAAVLYDAIFFNKVTDTRVKLNKEQLEKYEKLINNQ